MQQDDFTLAEMEFFESTTGEEFDYAMNQMQKQHSRAIYLIALHTILKRRTDPSWDIEKSRALTVTQVADELEAGRNAGKSEGPNRAARRQRQRKRPKRATTGTK